MIIYYIEYDADGVPFKYYERSAPFKNYDTRDNNRGTGFIEVATREGFTPFDSATQIRTGPVLEAEPAVIRYTVREKTTREIDDLKQEAATNTFNQLALNSYALAINDGSIVPGSNMTDAEIIAAMKAKM